MLKCAYFKVNVHKICIDFRAYFSILCALLTGFLSKISYFSEIWIYNLNMRNMHKKCKYRDYIGRNIYKILHINYIEYMHILCKI